MAVLRLSEEIHVILNRFYIAQVIIILSDFADILAWLAHQTLNKVLSSSTRGQTLSNICMWTSCHQSHEYSKLQLLKQQICLVLMTKVA